MSEPVQRSRLRRAVSREFFIARRHVVQSIDRSRQWTSRPSGPTRNVDQFSHCVAEHSSLILRPLAGVDMELQHNKRRNLELAVERIDATVLPARSSFSFWRHVGRPTVRRGFLPGLVLDQGGIASGIGGGLCQLSNLLFWIFAHGGVQVVERHRHAYDVFPDVGRAVPFGAGATVAYNYVDLVVRNASTRPLLIRLQVGEHRLSGSLWASSPSPFEFRIVERDHHFDQQSWGGYTRHNVIVRQTVAEDKVVSEETLCVNDAIVMYSPMLDSGA